MGSVGALAAGFGHAGTDALRVSAALYLFVLPGWIASLRWLATPELRADVPLRLSVGFSLSYALYGWTALCLRLVGLGFDAYLCVHGLFLVAVLWWSRAREPSEPRSLVRHPANLLLPVAAVLAAFCFANPTGNDIPYFEAQTLESARVAGFTVSAIDVAPFGVDEPHPRMTANLLHVFIGLLAYASDVSPRVVLHLVAPILLGTIALLGLSTLVRHLAGERVHPAWAFLAVTAPWSALYSARHVYFYEFRFLNSPALDKDFALFVALPPLLLGAWRYLRFGEQSWLALPLLGAVPLAWSHPVAPVFLVMGCAVLCLAISWRHHARRVFAVLAASGFGLAVAHLVIDPTSTQELVGALTTRDLDSGTLHYDPMFYPSLGREGASGIDECCGGRLIIEQEYFFGSSLVSRSIQATLLWSGLVAVGAAVRRPRNRLMLATGALAAATAGVAWWLATASPLSFSVLLLSGAMALLSALGTQWLAIRTQAGDECTDYELIALRLQAAWIAALVLTYVLGSALVSHSPAMVVGLTRLAWFYFGFLAFAHLGARLQAGLAHGADAIGRSGRLVSALPAVVLFAHVGDLVANGAGGGRTMAERVLPFLAHDPTLGASTPERPMHAAMPEVGRGLASAQERPLWLASGDCVLMAPYSPWFRERYALLKQQVFYREPLAEAHAWDRIGDDFLREIDAYNDFHDRRVTPRLVDWLQRRRVSLIVFGPHSRRPDRRFVRGLARAWEGEIQPIEEFGYRIAPATDGDGRGCRVPADSSGSAPLRQPPMPRSPA